MQETQMGKKVQERAQEEPELLKLQIIALRPELCQLRLQKKQKKLELNNCLQTGCGDKDAIWQEILDLKVKMNNLKSQIQPLKQSIKDLKSSSKQQ
jgi:regulator of replication initiation timing